MHEHAVHQAELDREAYFKPSTSFVARKTKTRKPGRIDRAFGKREYEFSYKFGSVVEHKAGGFGFGSADRAFFVRSKKNLTPPLETDLAIAVGTITRSNGRATRPKLVLLGYSSEKTGLVYTRGNWHMLPVPAGGAEARHVPGRASGLHLG